MTLSTYRRRPRRIVGVILTLLAAVASVFGIAYAQMPNPPQAGGWLKSLPQEKQIEAIDRQLRGFDMAMFEVNYRYTEMYFAGIEGNWDYALYTGEKIAWAVQNGFERRPKRRANAEELFFKEAYPKVLDAIRKKDIALFKERVDVLRNACNACHTAEKVGFIQVGSPSIKQTPLVHN
jgi:cytochrome c556